MEKVQNLPSSYDLWLFDKKQETQTTNDNFF